MVLIILLLILMDYAFATPSLTEMGLFSTKSYDVELVVHALKIAHDGARQGRELSYMDDTYDTLRLLGYRYYSSDAIPAGAIIWDMENAAELYRIASDEIDFDDKINWERGAWHLFNSSAFKPDTFDGEMNYSRSLGVYDGSYDSSDGKNVKPTLIWIIFANGLEDNLYASIYSISYGYHAETDSSRVLSIPIFSSVPYGSGDPTPCLLYDGFCRDLNTLLHKYAKSGIFSFDSNPNLDEAIQTFISQNRDFTDSIFTDTTGRAGAFLVAWLKGGHYISFL